jgi:hypothetical protein
MTFKTDQNGRLALAGIHDSSLTEMAVDYLKKEASLLLVNSDKITTKVVANNIIVLNISDLWDEVIIDGFYVWPITQVSESFMYDYDAGWRHLLRGRIDEKEKIIDYVQKLKLSKPNAILCSMTSSYGGGLSILAEDINISQEKI